MHGPLTLALMLQVVTKHLSLEESKRTEEDIMASLEYRNLAPLYCDEEMRVCIKRKKQTPTESLWNVWIEGPTGGMAVKALVRTGRRGRSLTPNGQAAIGDAIANLPKVRKIVGKEKEQDASTSQVSRGEPREDRRVPFSHYWRRRWMNGALPYLYIRPSPLLSRLVQPERQDESRSSEEEGVESSRSDHLSGSVHPSGPARLPTKLTGHARRVHALPYLYGYPMSALKTRLEAEPDQPRGPPQAPKKLTGCPHLNYLYRERGRQSALVNAHFVQRVDVRKVKGLTIRKTDIGLKETSRKRGPRSLKAWRKKQGKAEGKKEGGESAGAPDR